MKNKILILIIGILIGAIIATSAFLIYSKKLEKDSNQIQTNENGRMQLPQNGNMGEPPEKPNKNGGTLPKMTQNSNNI